MSDFLTEGANNLFPLISRMNQNKVGCIAMPDIFKIHNANREPCDMLVGPCCCGACHSATDWVLHLNGSNVYAEGSIS